MTIIYIAIHNESMAWEFSNDYILGAFSSEAQAHDAIEAKIVGLDFTWLDHEFRIEPMALNTGEKLDVIHCESFDVEKMKDMEEQINKTKMLECYDDLYFPATHGSGKASRFAPPLH